MKYQITLSLITTIVLIVLLFVGRTKGQSKQDPTRVGMVVCITAKETYGYDETGHVVSTGMVVEYCSSGNVAGVPSGTPIGQALAGYLSLGMKLQPQVVYWSFVLTN